MKAEELRIGAIVQYKWFDKPSFRKTIIHREQVSVLAIDGENKRVLIKPKQYRKNHTWVSLERIKSIPLSEEVLLKCGFIRGVGVMYFLPIPNLKCEIHATWFHGQFVIEIQNDRIPIVSEVVYLHQLQNFYYALTGEELEVSL